MRNKALPLPVLTVALGLAALGTQPGWAAERSRPLEAPTATSAQPALPQAVVDLTTAAGSALVHGLWRYSDAQIVETAFRAPDASGQPKGALDGRTLYLCARSALYRIPLLIPGIRP